MTPRVLIAPVDEVFDHPNADRLSICRIMGNEVVTGKTPDLEHAFEAGERAIYVPVGAKLSPELLRQHGLWDRKTEKGKLSEAGGDVVAPVDRRGAISAGLLWKLPSALAGLPDMTDVATSFGITDPRD